MAAILFDLDGVLYEGDKAIAGAAAAIHWFEQRNIPHLFLTNTTSKPRASLVDKLAGFGIHSDPDNFLTPPIAATHWLKQNVDGRVALFTPSATRADFTGLQLCEDSAETGAAAVVIGDLGEGWNFNTLNRAFRLLHSNPQAKLVALGMTRYWRAADGLRLDTAPFVKALHHATGREIIVLGKPSQAFYQAAIDMLRAQPADTIMIGDDIRSDIEGAAQAGLRTILVGSGKFQHSDLELGITPDAFIDTVATLPDWWQTHIET
jgi:phospholysine phosphohistidine inorganic pyrophosphate phosphatase